MAWNVTEIVSTSGTRDWDTLGAFESDHDGDTPATGACTAQVRGSVSNSTYWSGWQSGQTSTIKIVIEATSGNEPDGVNDATGDKALISSVSAITEADQWYQDWIDLEFTGTTTGTLLNVTPDGGGVVHLVRCVFRDVEGNAVRLNTLGGNACTLNVGGCLFKDTSTYQSREAVQCTDSNGTLNIINTTVVGSNGTGTSGILQSAGTVSIKNVAVGDCTSDITGTVSSTTSGSEDGDADFTIVMTDGVDFKEPSADDYTIPDTDSDLYEAGTTVVDSWFTTLCATDFAGTTWGDTPSVGCFEFPTLLPIKFTVDRVRHKPVFVIHDFPYTSGDGATDYLLFWDRMDSVIDNHTPEYSAGGDTVDVNSTDTVDADGVTFDTSGDGFDFPTASNIDKDSGSISFDYTPNFNGSDPTANYYLFITQSSFYAYVQQTNGYISFVYGGTSIQDITFSAIAGTKYHLRFNYKWDGTNSIYSIIINNKIVKTGSHTTQQAALNTDFVLGNFSNFGAYICQGKIDNFKILSEPIFPYGAYFTGNTAAQLSAGMYHKDILFHWDCDMSSTPTAQISGGSDTITVTSGPPTDVAGLVGRGTQFTGNYVRAVIASSGNIDFEQGSMGFWYKYTGSAGIIGICYTDVALDFSIHCITDGFQWSIDNATIIYPSYTGVKALLEDGNWHSLSFHWYYEASNCKRWVIVDGISTAIVTTAFTNTCTSTELRIGNISDWSAIDGIIDEFYITSDPNTPQIPTVNGVPLDVPLLDKS